MVAYFTASFKRHLALLNNSHGYDAQYPVPRLAMVIHFTARWYVARVPNSIKRLHSIYLHCVHLKNDAHSSWFFCEMLRQVMFQLSNIRQCYITWTGTLIAKNPAF